MDNSKYSINMLFVVLNDFCTTLHNEKYYDCN